MRQYVYLCRLLIEIIPLEGSFIEFHITNLYYLKLFKTIFMKKTIILAVVIVSTVLTANAQLGKFVNSKTLGAAQKTVQAFTISDEQLAAYCQEYIDWMDAHNPVCDDTDPGMKVYSDRLNNILSSIKTPEGIKLDIKVYYVVDQNAFACANGSVRVFAGLMDLMNDDEIIGIIGHEIGHIVKKDSKDAFRTALLTSALKDAVASTSGKAAALTDSQIGQLGEALVNSQFSQKQEYDADDYGYNFLKTCGKDPKAMASALRIIQKLQDDAGGDKSKFNQLFSTHPESGKRADKLDKK